MKYRLFQATITREVLVVVPLSDGADGDLSVAWDLAETVTRPDPNDAVVEEVKDCERVTRILDPRLCNLVPLAEPHNTRTVQQLIDAGELDVRT